ncbi:MAG: bifunctional hydroxymethylpyrimidine kinase/phosphomethylpyrimidine kinase [Bacilli bacterium]
MKKVLTIAGSDCSGGAGIQADLKTITTNGVYAMSVLTALTAQNTVGVQAIAEVDSSFVGAQLDSVFTDIFPDAIKIGMVLNEDIIDVIAEKLKYYNALKIVVDPVMVSTSGAQLISEEAIYNLKTKLFPLASIITPNILEAEILANMKINNIEDMIMATKKIHEEYGCAVLCKGGHSVNDANDLLYINGKYQWFTERRIDNPNTHGTGCTLSSAIASNLAKGYSLIESVENSKNYITNALLAMLDLGQKSGPLNHMWELKK